MRIGSRTLSLIILFALAALSPRAASAAGETFDCEMRYELSGWSAFYKHATGTGTISCTNGQSIKVSIVAKGGGITFGKTHVEDGKGKFSEVRKLNDLLGAYASAEAHAGAGKSSSAQVLTKGGVSLALAGTGQGVDIGIAFGKFVISKR
jgi:hypothetical protein